MQLDKLTGGSLVATNHRVNTLRIDADRLGLARCIWEVNVSLGPFGFRFTLGYARSTKLDKPVVPLPQFASSHSAKVHSAPNPKMEKLMAVENPLVRSGYARMLLFPAAAKKLYPTEFEEARRMGIV